MVCASCCLWTIYNAFTEFECTQQLVYDLLEIVLDKSMRALGGHNLQDNYMYLMLVALLDVANLTT